MPTEVSNFILINKPVSEVYAYAVDPDNAPEWYANIKSIEWETERPLQVGSRLAFVAAFLGRRLAYTYQVMQLIAGESFIMRTAEGPFPMETTYLFRALDGNTTEMVLRNRGEPSGFSKITAPLMIAAMNSANRKDLISIKSILERQT